MWGDKDDGFRYIFLWVVCLELRFLWPSNIAVLRTKEKLIKMDVKPCFKPMSFEWSPKISRVVPSNTKMTAVLMIDLQAIRSNDKHWSHLACRYSQCNYEIFLLENLEERFIWSKKIFRTLTMIDCGFKHWNRKLGTKI